MYKILKWVYKLGYKAAEDRYYFALKSTIDERQYRLGTFTQIVDPTEEQREEADKERWLMSELRLIVNLVFEPLVDVPVETKDRFKP